MTNEIQTMGLQNYEALVVMASNLLIAKTS